MLTYSPKNHEKENGFVLEIIIPIINQNKLLEIELFANLFIVYGHETDYFLPKALL